MPKKLDLETRNSALTQCKDCGKQISKSARSCPACGKPKTNFTLISWLVVAASLLVAGYFYVGHRLENIPVTMASPAEMEAITSTFSSQPVTPVAKQVETISNPVEVPSAMIQPVELATPVVVNRECNGIMPRTVEDFRNVTFNIVNTDQPRVYFHTQPNNEPANQSTAYLVPEDVVVVLPSQVPDQNGFRCVSYMASKALYNGQPKQTNGWMPISALYALPKVDRMVVDPLNNITGADLSQSELVHINPFGQKGNFAVIPNTFENSTYGFVMEASADELASGRTSNRYESPIKRPISASEFEQFMKTQSACAMFAKLETPFHIMVMTGRCDGDGGKDTMVYENFMPQPQAKLD